VTLSTLLSTLPKTNFQNSGGSTSVFAKWPFAGESDKEKKPYVMWELFGWNSESRSQLRSLLKIWVLS